MNHRAVREMMRRPSAYARFLATGQLPRGTRPQSPLIDLLSQIGARDRLAIKGLRVDARLGYEGSRVFHNAEQAFHWVKPSDEVFGAFPAESWRNKRFVKRLSLDDLLANCSGSPEGLVDRYPRLRSGARA